jgi:hypothetical protein
MLPSPLARRFASRHRLLSQRQTIPYSSENSYWKREELSIQTHIFLSALAAALFEDTGAIRNVSSGTFLVRTALGRWVLFLFTATQILQGTSPSVLRFSHL